MRHKTDPRAIASYLAMLEATNGKRHIKHRNHMQNSLFFALPGETEAEARERLRLERRDFLTPREKAEERQQEVLRELRQNANNPNL